MGAKRKTEYVCTECGYDSPKWFGKCPSCGEWNTMKEIAVTQNNGSSFVSGTVIPENEPVAISHLFLTLLFSINIFYLEHVLK